MSSPINVGYPETFSQVSGFPKELHYERGLRFFSKVYVSKCNLLLDLNSILVIIQIWITNETHIKT